jgi:AcrR family transcriptional regulator
MPNRLTAGEEPSISAHSDSRLSVHTSGRSITSNLVSRFEDSGASAKGERTRQRIVAAAIRQFGEMGYRQTSIASVARSIGLTPAAVYPYFATKDDLFRGAANADIDAWITNAQNEIGESATPWLTLAVRLMHQVRTHTLVWRILSEEPASTVSVCMGLPAVDSIRTKLTEELAVAKAMKLLPDSINPDETGAALQAMFLAFVVLHARTGLNDLDKHLESLARLIVASLER